MNSINYFKYFNYLIKKFNIESFLDFKNKEQEKRLNLLNLDLDMEIICACLEQEVQVS
jgi:hypothetical protein